MEARLAHISSFLLFVILLFSVKNACVILRTQAFFYIVGVNPIPLW